MVVDPIGACRRCISALPVGSALLCTDPHVRGCGAPVPCEDARLPHRGCGPEAFRLHWPAIGVVPDDRVPPLKAAA